MKIAQMTSSETPKPPAAPLPPPARSQLAFRGVRTILALILREMTTTYGRSPGGYIWAVLQPISIIVILALGFSLLLRAPSLGTSFMLFYASAVLPLRLFQELSGNVGAALVFNRALMGYPRVTFLDAILARAALCVLTQIMVSFLILAGIFVFDDIREIIDFVPILQAYAATIFLGLGVGILNCFLTTAYPVWKTIWGILSRPLLLISGVFYVYEDLPKIVQDILWLNPIMHISGISRTGFYSTYSPEYISLTYVFVFGAIPMFFGMVFLKRYAKDILHN